MVKTCTWSNYRNEVTPLLWTVYGFRIEDWLIGKQYLSAGRFQTTGESDLRSTLSQITEKQCLAAERGVPFFL